MNAVVLPAEAKPSPQMMIRLQIPLSNLWMLAQFGGATTKVGCLFEVHRWWE